MKQGILQAISDCRLRDALRLLESCVATRPVEFGHKCLINACLHDDDAYAHALIAKIELGRWPDSEFRPAFMGSPGSTNGDACTRSAGALESR